MPESHNRALMRANDGVSLPNGTFLFGTMEQQPSAKRGAIYLVDDKGVHTLHAGIGIPNTFIALPDQEGSVLISDSMDQKVYLYRFSWQEKAMIDRSLWLDLSETQY